MTCEIVKPLLSEFADDTLEASVSWQVQTHLTECASCGRISREIYSLHHALTALPVRQPSAQFESSLAQRLALTRRPENQTQRLEKRQTWREKLALTLTPILSGPRPRMRPVFTLGLAVTAVATVALVPHRPSPTPDPVVVTRGVDRAFVADCVAQRRRDAAAEPLADLAAQNLAGHLDNAAATDTAAATASPPSADAELF